MGFFQFAKDCVSVSREIEEKMKACRGIHHRAYVQAEKLLRPENNTTLAQMKSNVYDLHLLLEVGDQDKGQLALIEVRSYSMKFLKEVPNLLSNGDKTDIINLIKFVDEIEGKHKLFLALTLLRVREERDNTEQTTIGMK